MADVLVAAGQQLEDLRQDKNHRPEIKKVLTVVS